MKWTMVAGSWPAGSRLAAGIDGGASVLTLLIAAAGMMAVTTMPAFAACDVTSPGAGDPVTCSPGSPETDPIIAPGSTDVTVDFLPGAILQTASSPAISLGGGAQVNLGSGTITDIDPGLIPLVIGNVIAGDYSGVIDREDFVDQFVGIAATAPVIVTPGAATIELGVPSGVAARDTALHEITAVVTVQKAKMADQAMNAITQYITSSYDPNYGLPTGGPILEAPGTNQVVISGGTIVAGGAAAIRAADDSATLVLVTGGGTIASLAENGPAISMGEDSALHVVLGELQSTTPSGGTIFTAADGAGGIDAGRDASALAVYLLGDSHITTTGDNAAAIIGPGSLSVMAFEARGGLATDGRPMISTFGDNSAGVLMHGEGSSAATLHIRDLYDTAFGPGMQTNGDNSTLFDVDLGDDSSISFIASSSNLGTFGDGSGVIRLLEADNSDILSFLENTTLMSSGDNSTLFESARGASSVSSFVAIGVDLDALGEGTGGIIQRVTNGGANSADTTFIANGTINTQGDDAPAFLIEQGGASSVRTSVFFSSDFSTVGANSAGVYIGGLGDGSALDATLEDVAIATGGDNSAGLFIGGLGDGSALSISALGIEISTTGDNSNALEFGAVEASSVSSYDIANSTFSTDGVNSAGILIDGLVGQANSSTTVSSMTNITVATLGADSTGIRVGDPDVDLGGPANITGSSRTLSLDKLNVSTVGDRSKGLALHGFGNGNTDSDTSVLLVDLDVLTQGDDSAGVLVDVFGDGYTDSLSTLVMAGATIDTEGDRSAGLIVGDGAGANTGIAGSSIEVFLAALDVTTAGDDSIGILVELVGSGADSSVLTTTLQDITVATSGANSHGIVLGEDMGTSIVGTPSPPSSTSIASHNSAELAAATAAIGAGPLTVARRLTMTDVSATTSGNNAHALVIGENTTLTLDPTNIGETTVDGTIVSGTIDSFDGFVATGSGSRAVMNHGILYGTFTVGPGVRGNLGSTGLIESVGGPAIDLAGGATVELLAGSRLLTSGNNAPGILISDTAGGEATTLSATDSTLETSGNNSTLVDVDVGDESSVSFSAEDTSFATTGDGSGVVSMMTGEQSDLLIFMENATLSSEGEDATLLQTSMGVSSIRNMVVTNSTFSTAGDGSAGMIHTVTGAPGSSGHTFFIGNSSISTEGNDAGGFVAEGIASSSSVGTIFFDTVEVSTQGENSGAFFATAASDGSAGEITVTDSTIATAGNGSTGFTVAAGGSTPGAGAAGSSVFTLSVGATTIETAGDNSGAMIVAGAAADSSLSTISIQETTLRTTGDDSAGLILGAGATDNSVSVYSLSDLTVETGGARSIGIHLVDRGFGGGVESRTEATLTDLAITTAGANAHGLVLDAWMGTEIVGSDDENELAVERVSASTSGDNAHALVIGEDTTLSLLGQNHTGATTDRGTIVNGTLDSFDGFVATGMDARAVMNHGILYGTFTVDDAVIGNLANNGLIESEAGAGGVAVLFTGTTNDIFELQPEGVVIGTVEAGLGVDAFVLGGIGTQIFDVELIGTQYNGFEQLEKIGASTWTLEGTNPFAGPMLVRDGTLVHNASLENVLMTVGAPATLMGNGILGGLTLNDGSTLAPGNSIGTITVTGNVLFDTGSTYEVEIAAGGNTPGIHNDLVVADTATVNAGAILHVTPDGSGSGPGYAPNTRYTVIETGAAGNLTLAGAPTITDSFAFFSFEGSDDGQNYYLTSSAAASFCLPGASFNQCSTGEAVRDLGAGNLAYNAVASMSEADAIAAFDALSGEIHASGQHVIDQTFALFSDTLGRKGHIASATGQTLTAPLGYSAVPRDQAGVVAIDGAGVDPHVSDAQLWLTPLAGGGGISSDGNAAALGWGGGGLAGGYEMTVDTAQGEALAGIALGYARSHVAAPARRSSLDVDALYAGIYGGWSDGQWSLSGSLAAGGSHIESERRIVLGGIDEMARADYWGHSVGVSGEAAYAFDLGNGTTISPLFTLDAGWSGHGGFTETGAGALNLTGTPEAWARFDAGIGVALSHTVLTEHGEVTLDGRLVWEHAFAGVVPSQSLAFAGGPAPFEVRGADAGRDRLRLGLGASYQATEDIKVRADYEGVFSGGEDSHAVRFGLNVRF